jgi:branched-chain amino acid transport system permease protein
VSQFFELLLSGLMLGCIYGLIAMGFVIVFKATNVVNFAHASVVMLGAFLVAKWHESARSPPRRSRARWPPRCSTSSSCGR